jgi:hypothetical protein
MTGIEEETLDTPGVLVPTVAVVGKRLVGVLEMTGTPGELVEIPPVTVVVPVVEVIATVGRVKGADEV